MKKLLNYILVLALSLLLVAAPMSLAATDIDPCGAGAAAGTIGCNNVFKSLFGNLGTGTVTDKVVGVIRSIANAVILIIGAISVLMLVYGAWQYISGNDAEGKKTITNSIIGLVIAIVSFSVISLIVTFVTGGATA